VEEESAFGQGVLAEAVEEGAPCAEAVDAQGEVARLRQIELGEEHGGLVVEVVVFDPAIEAALAEAGCGVGVEAGAQGGEPIRRTGWGVPWVESEGGLDEGGEAPGEVGREGPVGFGGSVDDAAGDVGGFQSAEDLPEVRGEARILKMVVSVAEVVHDGGRPAAGGAF